MSRAKRLLACVFAAAVAFPVFAADYSTGLSNPAQEAQARALFKELRCLICQGESIDESSAPLAADLRQIVREHVVAGESDGEIKAFLVARYGDFILMKPPVQPDTYFLWAAPALVLLLGGMVIWITIRRASRRASDET